MNRASRDHGDEVAKRIGTTEDMAGAAVFLALRAGRAEGRRQRYFELPPLEGQRWPPCRRSA